MLGTRYPPSPPSKRPHGARSQRRPAHTDPAGLHAAEGGAPGEAQALCCPQASLGTHLARAFFIIESHNSAEENFPPFHSGRSAQSARDAAIRLEAGGRVGRLPVRVDDDDDDEWK